MAEGGSETATGAKPKRKPIVWLGIFLISHSFLFSVVFSAAGVVALLLLPILAKNTYISENALMPGSVASMLSNQEVAEANRLVNDLINSNSKTLGSAIGSQRIIAQHMSNLGAEVSFHKFHRQLNQFHPLHFFSSPDSGRAEQNVSCALHGVNAVGIIRAPRGDGKEAIVLVTPFNSAKVNPNEAFSLGIAYSVFSLLNRVPWLAKDIIWLVPDSQFGEYAAVSAWLRDYHTPVFSGLGTLDAEMCPESNNLYGTNENLSTERAIYDGFKRAGTMAAALVIKVADRSEHFEDSLGIYAEASNGQMPNLDLINVVNYLAVHRQGLRVKVEKVWSLLGLKWLKTLGEILESLGHFARSLNPDWKFGIPAADYVEGSATLASSLYNQALGIPTGPHGAFRDYQIDAITLEIFPQFSSLENIARRNDLLLRSARLIEGVIRSVNNLLEKFHQSFFLYLLTSPAKFVSVGVYMIAFALLVAPLPLVAASLYVNSSNSDSSVKKGKPASSAIVTLESWKWLYATKKAFIVHLWGSVVSLLPYFICQIPSCTPTTSFAIWVSLSLLSLVVMYMVLASPSARANESQPQREEWPILKSVTLSAAFTGLCLMSVINFATAEIGGLLMVPMCLMAHPLKPDVKARSIRTLSRAVCNLILGFIGFPPVAFIVLKAAFEGSGSTNLGDFWSWVESLWAWNSATYLYIVSLVSKRWLHLYRTSTTSLSLRLTSHHSTLPSLSSLLSHYPFLSSLSLLLPSDPTAAAKNTAFSDHLLLLFSSFCPQLRSLRFLAGPVSLSSLTSLSSSCTHLTSLCINLSRSRPLFLMWVIKFPSLKELSVLVCSGDGVDPNWEHGFSAEEDSAAELGLESLCLSGIGAGDWGFGWLWRSCRKLKKLQLKSCEGIGDGGSFSSFAMCLQGVQELELRTCRAIIDGVLLKVAENCDSLTSLLVYDGGSRDGLLRFFSQSRCNLRKLDFRLPLDLDNDHLLAVAMNLRSISSIKLQSCCLVSGEGIKALAIAASSGLEELALVNCDVVEREPGLLATLGQNLRQLRKLDLSYNEMLVDKEFASMLVSCNDLVDLRLRGCRGLTYAAMVSIFNSCRRLESVDIMHCSGIQAEAIELFVLNSPQLRQVQVEQSKITDAAKTRPSCKFVDADA